MDNLKYWDKMKQPPKEVLKTITAGRLKGMSDIKPQWRIQVMTENFGVCGIGWKFEVAKRWLENVCNDQVFAFVDVNVYIKVDDQWSEPIPGNGGSALTAKESKGLYSSDEAYKMATTDALSSAFKMLGVAADVYMGNFDGSKYTTPPPIPEDKKLMTKYQSDSLIEFCKKEKLEPVEVAKQYGITKKITKLKFDQTFDLIKEHVKSGDLGYKFAIPEGEDDLFEGNEE